MTVIKTKGEKDYNPHGFQIKVGKSEREGESFYLREYGPLLTRHNLKAPSALKLNFSSINAIILAFGHETNNVGFFFAILVKMVSFQP